MTPASGWLLLLAALWLAAGPPAAGAAACPSQGPETLSDVLDYRTGFPSATVHRDLDTEALEELGGFAQQGRWATPGFTSAQHRLERSLGLRSVAQRGANGACVAVEALAVDFSYVRLDVYASSDYPDGSCEAEEILGHERAHVDAHRRVYERCAAELERVLRAADLPSPARPRRYASLESARRAVEAELSRVVLEFYKRFEEELAAENRALDSPENYRALRSRCTGW